MKRQWIMKHEEDTKSFGQHLANNLKPGDVVALIGDLGTGKTALTKAVATGLGVTGMITSPTFTIVCEYHEGRMPLYHFDVYRLAGIDDMLELGYEEYFYGDGICVVEWADRIEKLLPENTKTIKIGFGDDPDERIYICDF